MYRAKVAKRTSGIAAKVGDRKHTEELKQKDERS